MCDARIVGRVALLLAGLALAGCAAPASIRPPPGAAERAAAADWSRAATMEVTLDEFAFLPEELALRVGQPVRLRFTNSGARPHDWTSPGFFRAVALRPGEPAGEAVLAAGGSVEVQAGAVREVTVLPLAAGSHAVTCVKPLHATLGMTGRVVVTE